MILMSRHCEDQVEEQVPDKCLFEKLPRGLLNERNCECLQERTSLGTCSPHHTVEGHLLVQSSFSYSSHTDVGDPKVRNL